MKEHTVRSFDEALQTVIGDVLEMAHLARGQLAAAIDLLGQDAADETLMTIDDEEDRVDELDARIAGEVQRLLALRQPVGVDLRTLISCDRIATDLERIGDHSKSIAERFMRITEQPSGREESLRIRPLADSVLEQLDRAIEAIEQGDAAAAKAVCAADRKVDALYDETFRVQVEAMCRKPNSAPGSAHALFIAKSLERVGDHATNVAEDLIYWLEGERSSKRENPA